LSNRLIPPIPARLELGRNQNRGHVQKAFATHNASGSISQPFISMLTYKVYTGRPTN